MNWTELSKSRRVEVLKLLENKTGLNANSIEKDWWVTLVLNSLFNGLYGSHLVFKGGTSLSKCLLPNAEFSDNEFKVRAVLPQRTMLEKAFLLHEMLQSPTSGKEINRMSRHLYDLEKLMDCSYCKNVLNDSNLYNDIIKHREQFTSMVGVDYLTHQPETICFVPTEEVLKNWEKDYQLMQENMIYGDSLSFNELIIRIRELNLRFNSTKF